MTTATTTTITICGDTFRAREWLKENGYKWDADSKVWTRFLVPAVNKFNGTAGFATEAGIYVGSLDSIKASVVSRAKSERITVTAE